jgi:polysaccharide pyruvyl transferase WcaK-like protein
VVVQRPRDAMRVFAGGGLVLAMRLHGLILAAAAGAPVAALSYDPKVEAAAADLGCPCVPLDQPPPADVTAQWRACLDRPADPAVLRRLRASTAVHDRVLARLG